MTLRRKTLLVTNLMLLTLIIILTFSAKAILLGGFSDVETRETELDITRAIKSIQTELNSLNSFVKDWAEWNYAHEFIINPNQDFVLKKLDSSIFLSQKIQLMVFLDNKLNIIYGTTFDPASKSFRPLPESYKSHLRADSPLLVAQEPGRSKSGFIQTPENPLMVISLPLTSGESPRLPHGFLIIGRSLDKTILLQLTDRVQSPFQLLPYHSPELPVDFARAKSHLSQGNSTWIAPLTELTVAGYSIISDIYGKPGYLLRVDSSRFAYLQGKKTVQYFVFLLVALGLLFSLTTLMLLEKIILFRLSNLQHQISQIGKLNEPSLRVLVEGHDELSELADSLNQTLQRLEKTQNELRESETATLALLDGMPDSLLRIDRNGLILDYKTGKDRTSSISPRLFAGNDVKEAFPGILADNIIAATEKALSTNETQLFEHEMVSNNRHIYFEIRVTPNGANETLAVFRDLTETRELQHSLRLADLRDPLTGLLNKAGWNHRLAQPSLTNDSRVGIITLEIDEMRLINESLGLVWGDRVMNATVMALRSSLPLESLIARIGDDEFAALLPNRTESELQSFCDEIRAEVERSNLMEGAIRFSVSLGYASGSPAEKYLDKLYDSAKKLMRRDKLSQSLSARELIFGSLQAALSTRDFIAHQHANRLWALCHSLAKAASLPRRRLRGLKLLTQFHDIGKVGIPDQLLFKKGSLTPGEMATMKLHVEIGHRIAQSIPDLFSIADLLLKHHEWWNGTGYPLGLQQEEIPLECRIFSIADTFDSMTQDRSDRQAFSGKEAAAELRRSAGSQFDPLLVAKFLAILGEDF